MNCPRMPSNCTWCPATPPTSVWRLWTSMSSFTGTGMEGNSFSYFQIKEIKILNISSITPLSVVFGSIYSIQQLSLSLLNVTLGQVSTVEMDQMDRAGWDVCKDLAFYQTFSHLLRVIVILKSNSISWLLWIYHFIVFAVFSHNWPIIEYLLKLVCFVYICDKWSILFIW